MQTSTFKTQCLKLSFCCGICTIALFAQSDTTLKVATLSPEGSALLVELREAANAIEEETEGRVQFKFYAGGVMGDDFAVKRKMRARQLNGGILQTSVFTSDVPNLNVYNLPMQFKNVDEVAAVRTDLDKVLRAQLEEAGYVSFGFLGIGLAYAMGSKPATTVQETRRLKIWVPKNDPSTELMLRAFGVNPIPLSTVDVLTGLQTGLIDTVASPPVAAVTLQWHTHIKYMLDVPFLYVFSVYVLDQRSFRNINDDDQVVVRNHMDNAMLNAERKGIEDHASAFEAMLDQGIELLQPNEDALSEWQRNADGAAEEWVNKKLVTRSIFDQFKSSLQKTRRSNAD